MAEDYKIEVGSVGDSGDNSSFVYGTGVIIGNIVQEASSTESTESSEDVNSFDWVKRVKIEDCKTEEDENVDNGTVLDKQDLQVGSTIREIAPPLNWTNVSMVKIEPQLLMEGNSVKIEIKTEDFGLSVNDSPVRNENTTHVGELDTKRNAEGNYDLPDVGEPDIMGNVKGNYGRKLVGDFYHCKYCDEFYVLECALRIHERIHTGKKPHNPHKCQYCEKAFSSNCYLMRHERIHTGESLTSVNIVKKCSLAKVLAHYMKEITLAKSLTNVNIVKKCSLRSQVV